MQPETSGFVTVHSRRKCFIHSAPPALRGLEPPVEVQGKAVAKRLRGCSALYRFGSRQTPFAAARHPCPDSPPDCLNPAERWRQGVRYGGCEQ